MGKGKVRFTPTRDVPDPIVSNDRVRPIADIKKNCHNMPMKIAVKAQKLLGISLEGSVG